jgi:hypothetical protein
VLIFSDGVGDDDYREIWRRIAPADAASVALRLEHRAGGDGIGFLLILGKYVALAWQRTPPASGDTDDADDRMVRLRGYFASPAVELPADDTAWLAAHFFSCIACEGTVIMSSHPSAVGQPIDVVLAQHADGWSCCDSPVAIEAAATVARAAIGAAATSLLRRGG